MRRPRPHATKNDSNFITSTKFDVAVMSIITLNMLQMGCDWWEPAYHEPFPGSTVAGTPNFPAIADLKRAVSVLNLVFLGIYIIEMVVKWIGLGVVHYFSQNLQAATTHHPAPSDPATMVGPEAGDAV